MRKLWSLSEISVTLFPRFHERILRRAEQLTDPSHQVHEHLHLDLGSDSRRHALRLSHGLFPCERPHGG
jgi:hypothetical protein